MNTGNYWSKEEEKQLMEEIHDNLSITEIAKNHGRTENAIKMRIEFCIQKLHNKDKYTISTLADMFHKTIEEINCILKNSIIENKFESKKNKNEEIENRLDKIEKLLNKILKKISENK